MTRRDLAMLASGAALAAVTTMGLYEAGREGSNGSAAGSSRLAAAAETIEPNGAPPGAPASAASSTGGCPEPAAASRAGGGKTSREQIEQELVGVQREKRVLETRLRSLESNIERQDRQGSAPASAAELEAAKATGRADPQEFDLDQEDWKKLAEEGRVKYKIPCMLPPGSPWMPQESTLNELGLSPGDGEVIAEAHRRSNARIWDVVRPLCEDVVGDPGTVDLLGGPGCLRLIRQFSDAKDPAAARNAQRQVAEMHAGMRPRPAPDAPKDPMTETFLALTSEAQLFEADLAESFGPEDAKRIAQSNGCSATYR
jgi:hypothetical protein